VAVVGEPGTGKTTLLRTAINQLDKKTKAAFIFNTELNFEEILLLVLEISVFSNPVKNCQDQSRSSVEPLAISQMAAGSNVVIMWTRRITSPPKPSGLRLISNLESEEKADQIVITGQNELNENLKQPNTAVQAAYHPQARSPSTGQQ
jgi:general secretion pathway protein A